MNDLSKRLLAATLFAAAALLAGAAGAQAPDPGRNAAGVIAGIRGVPTIEYDLDKLPAPVRALRDELIAAARSGDVEKLRPIINRMRPRPDFGGADNDDPIEFLRLESGDGEGFEVLAILLDVLAAGYVHVDVGTAEESYVWPYFARYPIFALTKPQMIELFRIITGGEWKDSKDFGAYTFYRIGIAPDGSWQYFTAGI
jgi:hypothetical protein